MTLHGDDARSWAVSIGTHALLMLIAFFWIAFPEVLRLPREIDMFFEEAIPPSPELSPVVRPAVPSPARSSARVSEQRAATSPTPAASPRTSAPSARRDASVPSPTPVPAAGQDRPAPPVQPRTRETVEFTDFGTGKADVAAGQVRGTDSRGERREAALPGQSTSTRDTPGQTAAGGMVRDGGPISGSPTSSANIDWGDGLSRSRIAGSLPRFPQGATREAIIKVRFTVRPDGTVTGLTLLQKGEPLFEQASLSAMRSWKFNALPSSMEQQDQQGVATFLFRLN